VSAPVLPCGCCDDILDWIAGGLKVLSVPWHMKDNCLFTCGTNVFRMGSKNSSRNLEHARISNSYQGFCRGRWTVTPWHKRVSTRPYFSCRNYTLWVLKQKLAFGKSGWNPSDDFRTHNINSISFVAASVHLCTVREVCLLRSDILVSFCTSTGSTAYVV
jgi:hypothetical protein